MSDWRALKRLYGGKAKFVSILSDGIEVPWDPLTVGEVVSWGRRALTMSPEEWEDDLFLAKVRDNYLRSRLDEQKSGTVSRISGDIVFQSWPQNPRELDGIANFHRHQVYNSVIEDMVIWITRAFPSYNPDILYEKEFDDFMHIFCVAEKKLLQDGVLEKPVVFAPPVEEGEKPAKADLNEGRNVRDFKKAWDAQTSRGLSQSLDPLPAPEYDGKDTVIGKDDLIPGDLVADSKDDYTIMQADMLKKTAKLYPEYLEAMDESGKITPELIKQQVEERQKNAESRLEESKKEYAAMLARLRQKNRAIEAEADRKFKRGLGRRGRKKVKG